MEPKSIRFTGKKVVLFFLLDGSILDQFASMIMDNPQLNIHTIGMPTDGYSNTWEWDEDILLDRTLFMEQSESGKWDIYHPLENGSNYIIRKNKFN